jgi:two-component system, sensor histidine kinase and response regulator
VSSSKDKQARMMRRFEEAQRRARIGTFEYEFATRSATWSPVMYELHGLPLDAPAPDSFEAYAPLVHPDDLPAFQSAVERAQADTSRVAEVELRVRRDGNWVMLRMLLHCDPGPDGKPAWLSGTMQDISGDADRRSELIQDRERARDEARAKTRFLARVTHELRTPLAGVIGMIDLALGDHEPAVRADHLTSARASARHLLELIDDLLDASREDTWGINVVEIEFDLGEVLHQAIAMVAPRAQRKGLDLDGTIDSAVARARLGDPLRLRQILVNLLYNAVKFTPRGRVSARIDPDASAGAGEHAVVITIEDTGIGIAPEQQAAVFEPFVQAATPEKGGEGVGLGLAITRELVQALGGTIELRSEVGVGTRFTVRLSLRPGRPSRGERSDRLRSLDEGSSPSHKAVSSIGLRVLVAEDYPANAAIAQAVLERAGHRPHWVTDGEAAVAALEDERFDVILMDLEMPVLDGPGATRRIRAAEHAAGAIRLPIIALSAHKGGEHAAAAAGMDAYLRKPVDPDALDALLARVANGTMRGPIDHDARLARVGGRAELARTVAGTFLTHEPTLFDPIDAALDAKDAAELHRAAHGLRGALVMVGATIAAELAGDIERTTIADARHLRGRLAVEMARVVAELRLVAEPSSRPNAGPPIRRR